MIYKPGRTIQSDFDDSESRQGRPIVKKSSATPRKETPDSGAVKQTQMAALCKAIREVGVSGWGDLPRFPGVGLIRGP